MSKSRIARSSSEVRGLLSRCAELGASIERTQRGHVRLKLPNGKVVICGVAGPSFHLFNNIRSQIRRSWPERAADL